MNPYLAGLELVKKHPGTGGQIALAKCILSLYNNEHPFSIGAVLCPLDSNYTAVVMAMIKEYAKYGETDELCQAGKYVCNEFPRLMSLSRAMNNAQYEIEQEWQKEEERKLQEMYPDD